MMTQFLSEWTRRLLSREFPIMKRLPQILFNRPTQTHNYADEFKNLEEKLPPAAFFCSQKSYLVNLSKIQSIRNGYAFIGEKAIQIGEGSKEDLMKALHIG
jgi:hypothetical protein